MITVDPDVVIVDVDRVTVAWLPRRRELLELSDDAARLVRAVEAGDADAVPPTDIASLLDQLLELDVLVEATPSATTGAPAVPLVPDPAGAPPKPATSIDEVDVLGPFAALDWHFTVRVDDPTLADEIQLVLAHLATSRPAGARYEVTESDNSFALLHDGESITAGPTRAHVLAMLLWDVNRQAVAATPRHLVLHAGAVVVDGQAVVLPAAMEAGKTTLVTGLVRAGCGYLSDELAAVPDPDTTAALHVLPYPKALSLDPGSWPLFPDAEPPPDRHDLSENQWLVLPDELRRGAVVDHPVPLAAVVLPAHRPGTTTAMQRLEPVAALRALVECAFDFMERPAEVLPRLARVAERIPVHRLAVGDGVEEAVGLVLGAVPSGAGTAG